MFFGGIRPDGTFDEVGPAGIVEDMVFDTVTSTRVYQDGSELAGLYYYRGLIEGNYRIQVDDPNDLTPTRANNISNVNDEDKDSDGIRTDALDSVFVEFTFDNQKQLMNLVVGEEGSGDQDLGSGRARGRADDRAVLDGAVPSRAQ